MKENKLTKNLMRLLDFASPTIVCKECGEKLIFPDEIKYKICRGCGSEFITRRYL